MTGLCSFGDIDNCLYYKYRLIDIGARAMILWYRNNK
jgi:hypothetical protein